MTTRYLFEHGAVMFGAATGALAARGKRIDLFGVIVLGLVTAIGGGTLRDLLLDVPVFWIVDAWYVVTGTIAALVTFFAVRYVTPPTQTLQLVDAAGLAFVTMLGTSKTWQLGHPWSVCLVLGVTTGVAGGMIRDVLCGEVPLVFRAHINLYATAALAGAVAYLVVTACGVTAPANLLGGAFVIFGLRLAALKWQIRLPEFDSPK
ncbi:MAG TPA: trimeric intracellular cation channel family protein [Planctomycetaceae bacterium]|nr:trimeric intracellular cation channel family protein [Planctomycetaceae bacterium]